MTTLQLLPQLQRAQQQELSSFKQNNASEGCWIEVGVRFAYRRGVSTAAVGVAPAPAAAVVGVFKLPSHCEPPQTTICDRCECHTQTMSFPT